MRALVVLLNFKANTKPRNFTLSEHVYIILSYSIFIEQFRLKQKKKVVW